MTALPLAPSAKDHLRRVYEKYMAAELGELIPTAEALHQTCVALGWSAPPGYLPWAREQLELTEDEEVERWSKQRNYNV